MDTRKATIAKKSPSSKKEFKSVVAINLVPALLDKDLLQNHFAKFGNIVKIHVSSKNKSAIVSFSKASEAKAAKESGTIIDPSLPPLKMFFSDKGPEGRKPLSRTSIPSKAASSALAPASASAPRTQSPIRPLMSSAAVMEPVVKLPDTKNPDMINHYFYPDTPEAQELFSRKASTAEERYRLLEARDKLIRSRKPKVKIKVEFAEKLTGTCKDMCPEKERYMREVQRQLTAYEMARDGEVDQRKAIKAYSRSSADQEEPLPHELRPTGTLEMSMEYILHNIIPKEETSEDLGNWYNFVWDRMRSIRKDITQQQLFDKRAVNLMEKCARFHIHCSSRLSELDRHAFDPKLNDENLMKCLQSLEHMYTDLNLMGQTCENEPEFRAYQILMNLNEGDILWEIQQKPGWVLASPQVQFAIKVHMAIFEKNYSQFFKLVSKAPYLTACILHRYFFQVRSTALRTIFKAYSMHNKSENYTSLSAVRRVLGFGDTRKELFQYFCESHGVTCEEERDRIVLNRKTFEMPDFPSISREFYLIESKLDQPLNVMINGGPLGPNPYLTHTPHTSFDDAGYLIPGELTGVPDKKATISPQDFVDAKPKVFEAPKPPPSGPLPVQPAVSAASSLAHFFKTPSSAPSFSRPEPSSNLFEQTKPFPKIGEGSAGIGVFDTKPFPKFGDAKGTPGSNLFKQPLIPAPTPGLFTLPTLPPPEPVFPKQFALQRPQIEQKPKIEKVLRAAEKIFNDLVLQATKRISDTEISKAKREYRAGQEKKALIERKAMSIYAELEKSVTENEVKMFWLRRRQTQLVVNRKAGQICEDMVNKAVGIAIGRLSKAAYAEAVREREAKLRRLAELMRRLKIRFWLDRWRVYVKNRKNEREKHRECKLKELENFPAYQNTFLTSPEQLLQAWCGGVRRRRSLPISPELALPKKNLRRSFVREGERVLARKSKENLKDEEILKLVELYDFPASSNVNYTSPAAVLSSWCGLQLADDFEGAEGSVVGLESKKRRLNPD